MFVPSKSSQQLLASLAPAPNHSWFSYQVPKQTSSGVIVVSQFFSRLVQLNVFTMAVQMFSTAHMMLLSGNLPCYRLKLFVGEASASGVTASRPQGYTIPAAQWRGQPQKVAFFNQQDVQICGREKNPPAIASFETRQYFQRLRSSFWI